MRFTWRGIATSITDNSGAALPGPMMSVDEKRRAQLEAKLTRPEEAARQIMEAVEKNRPRVLTGTDAKMLDRIIRSKRTARGPDKAASFRREVLRHWSHV